MSNILATNYSKSNPNKTYNIIKGQDGVIYCDCMGWKMHKDCRHLREFHANGNTGVRSHVTPKRNCPTPGIARNKVTTPVGLAISIEIAVNIINGRKPYGDL